MTRKQITRKQVTLALSLLLLATAVMAAGGQAGFAEGAFSFRGRDKAQLMAQGAGAAQGRANAAEPKRPQDGPQQASPEIPDFVIYRELFRHMQFLKQKAAEKEKKGEDGSSYRNFHKRQAKLDDRQAAALDRIASACEAKVEQLDKRAKEIINAARAEFPGGRIPEGQTPPEPPAELRTMQDERVGTIMKARDELRAALGEREFKRFDDYVRENIAKKIKPVRFDRPRPDIPDSPKSRQPSGRALGATK
jgi:hypothetical protein